MPNSFDPDAELARLSASLRSHALYDVLETAGDLRTFAEHHVVCVLDFMSLLKSLQRDLTCVEVPWTPREDGEAARFLHEIVLGEESDRRADGRVQSHFSWYLEAMEEIGADTAPVRELVERLARGGSLAGALQGSRLPAAARTFGLETARAMGGPLHVRAAVFFHGREELIPSMFLPIVERLAATGLRCGALVEYLQRHVEVDGGEHGPLAERLLDRLCAGADGAARRSEALAAAVRALRARLALWDAIVERVGRPAPAPRAGDLQLS